MGSEVYVRQVRPHVKSEDDGKFVAIDVDSGEYEIDVDDYAAIARLQARQPEAAVWLEMVGEPTAYKLSRFP